MYAIRSYYASIAAVTRVSGANGIPGSPIMNDLLIYKEGQTMDDAIHIYNNTVDLEFPQLLGLNLLSGSFFQSYEKDSLIDRILISKTGAEMLGYIV